MKTLIAALIAFALMAGCVVAPIGPGYYSHHRGYGYHGGGYGYHGGHGR